jgi:Heterodisulfide reductase, subunit B
MNQDIVSPPVDNYYLFKSCTAGSVYPGIELSVKYILDIIGADYIDDPRQSSCAGFGVYTGAVPIETAMALNARNFSLAAETENQNIACICPMSYNNLKHCQKLLSKEKKLEKQFKSMLKNMGKKYDVTPEVSHISDAFLVRRNIIAEKAVYSLSGVKAVTHHGCHYSKFFFKDVTSGSFENPTVLDEILRSFGCEVVDYSEQFLCCGGGLHRSVVDREYPRGILKRKLASIAEVGPDVIVTQCPGCTFNLEYYQESLMEELNMSERIPVLYISELLALLLGAEPEDIGIDMHPVPVEPFLEKFSIGGNEHG